MSQAAATAAPPGTPLDTRLQLRTNGYDITIAHGKKAVQDGWPDLLGMEPEEIVRASAQFGYAKNTGINGATTPGLDTDIYDAEAAQSVLGAIEDWFGDRGAILQRIGLAPKFLVPFRCDQPFAKIERQFLAPNGTACRLELLARGQQFIAAGIHPDTGEPYRWVGDRGPCTVPRDALPSITEKEASELIDYLAALLTEQFGYTPAARPAAGNAAASGERRPPVDVDAEWYRLESGESANAVQTRIIPSLLRQAWHPDEVLTYVVDNTMAVAERRGLDWSYDVEKKAVTKRILSAYHNLLLKDYDHTTRVIPGWLPGGFHKPWAARLNAGQRPAFGYNHGGFYIRKQQGSGETEAPPAGSQDSANLGGSKTNNSDDEQTESREKKPGQRVLELRPFAPFDVAALPPRAWLYGRHYQRRTVSLTAGPGGMGKSSLDMVEAVAMTTVRNLLGEQPEQRLRVWYHNGEDPLDEIYRRLAAICQHYKIPQEELQGYLWVTSGNEFPLRVAKGYSNLEINAALVQQISTAVADNQIDLACFDPFVTLHSVSEVDSGKMDAVVRLFAGIADDNGAAIEIAHHVRKPAAGAVADYDVHDIRGVAAITDAVRAARVLNRMNERDAESAGCSEVERLSRFRVDRAKGNYSPAGAATWRHFISVELANGDDVGVVAPWDFPGQGMQTPEKTAADQKAEQVFLQLLDKFTARDQNVSANSGPSYAPAKFAEEREAQAAKVSKAALKAAMTRLLDAGRVRVERDGRSPRLVSGQRAQPK